MRTRTGYSMRVWLTAVLLVALALGCGHRHEGGGDTTRPTVSSTTPANLARGVAVNTKPTATFSEAMDPLTITTATFTVTGPGATPVSGAVTYVGTTATFSPANDLAGNTLFTATITTGAKDLAGNALATPYTWTFTTGLAPDTTPPTVSSTTPANAATGVALNTKPTATFSEAMDPLTITTATFTVQGPLTPVSGTVTYVGTTATFRPLSPLPADTVFTATITTGAEDLAGNAVASNFIWTFKTGLAPDTTRPTVSSTTPANAATGVAFNTKPTAVFSEVMDPLTITTATFRVTGPGATHVSGAVTYVGTTATFSPTANLTASITYTATITTGAKDLAGNALAGNQAPLPAASNYVWTFTTGGAADTTHPTVSSTTPANAATGVALNGAVNATFSEAMDPLTITTATFRVTGPGATHVSGTVHYVGTTATFSPTANLMASTTYTATITTGAEDLAGNALVPGLVPNPWTFTTGTGLAPGAVPLASASTFGIMATSAITNTGAATMINGDVSLNPGTSNGLLPAQVNGTIHINDAVSAQARADLLTAYNFAKALPPGTGTHAIAGGADLGGLDPGGLGIGVFPPGTYTSGSTMLINTPLVLDAGGNANAVWVFQIGSSLTTGANVSLAHDAQAKNVFWVPTASATIGVGTIFYGNIVAGVSATGVTGAVINGRILAGAIGPGTIALDTNTVNVPAP